MNIELIPNNADEDSPPHVNDGETPVIENIDHITPINTIAAQADEDISAAISDDTSATSIASELSDGISRPRSASLIIPPNNSTGDRPRSTPRMRPRSNPRTRTPMRHESPLLVISPIVAGAATIRDGDNVAAATWRNDVSLQRETVVSTTTANYDNNTDNDEQLIRNIFNTRNRRTRRLRAGSIPEEVEEHPSEDDGIAIIGNNDSVVDRDSNQHDNDTTAAPLASSSTTTASRTAGRFFSQAVAPNSTRRRNTQSQNQTTQPSQQRTLSTKQNPSHRKIRRWRNDAFIGTPSEHVHTMLMMNEGGGDHSTFPYMPNHPLEYNSEFKKLSGDMSRGGKVVRERFMRGEVASIDFALKSSDGEVGGEEEEEEEECVSRKVVMRCRQLGIATKLIACGDEFGKGLYDKLGSRIQSILSRSCGDGTSASRIVSDFESYLVSLALKFETEDADGNEVATGYPPLQPPSVYDLFNDILASPPRIVIRNKRATKTGKTAIVNEGLVDMNNCGVLIPTIHFYFPTEGQDGSRKRSSAFHRILLYAVCQFHGLETSSNVVPEKKTKKDGKKKKKKHGDGKGSMKVVTVQSGVLLAPDMKLLDFVCT